jgi:hypothetical protein
LTHFLKDETPIFNAYICLNPTFSPDINEQMKSYGLEKLSSIDNTYYFYMNDSDFISSEKKQQISSLDSYLKTLSIKNFNVKYDFSESSPSNVSKSILEFQKKNLKQK